MTLDQLPYRTEATIDAVDWAALGERDARRLRELGFDEGVAVVDGPRLGGAREPCGRGRMTVAIRRTHAARIAVAPVA